MSCYVLHNDTENHPPQAQLKSHRYLLVIGIHRAKRSFCFHIHLIGHKMNNLSQSMDPTHPSLPAPWIVMLALNWVSLCFSILNVPMHEAGAGNQKRHNYQEMIALYLVITSILSENVRKRLKTNNCLVIKFLKENLGNQLKLSLKCVHNKR